MNRRAIFTSAALKLDLAKLSGYFLLIALFGPVCGSTETYALDGTRSPGNAAPAIGQVAPEEAMYSANLRAWFRARQSGDLKHARKGLEDAGCDGEVGAAWNVGRMHPDVGGVEQ